VQVTRNQNLKIVFAHFFVKSESINIKPRTNDQRSILHILLNIFAQQKCFVFVIICNNQGELHVAEAR